MTSWITPTPSAGDLTPPCYTRQACSCNFTCSMHASNSTRTACSTCPARQLHNGLLVSEQAFSMHIASRRCICFSAHAVVPLLSSAPLQQDHALAKPPPTCHQHGSSMRCLPSTCRQCPAGLSEWRAPESGCWQLQPRPRGCLPLSGTSALATGWRTLMTGLCPGVLSLGVSCVATACTLLAGRMHAAASASTYCTHTNLNRFIRFDHDNQYFANQVEIAQS